MIIKYVIKDSTTLLRFLKGIEGDQYNFVMNEFGKWEIGDSFDYGQNELNDLESEISDLNNENINPELFCPLND